MNNALFAFAKAVGWGALAGAAPFMALIGLMLAWTPFSEGSLLRGLLMVLYPLMVSGALVLGSAIVIGLPLTAVLSQHKRDDGGIYALAGMVAGAAVAALVIVLLAGEFNHEAVFFAIPGAFAGLVTGTSWGRWREALNR